MLRQKYNLIFSSNYCTIHCDIVSVINLHFFNLLIYLAKMEPTRASHAVMQKTWSFDSVTKNYTVIN